MTFRVIKTSYIYHFNCSVKDRVESFGKRVPLMFMTEKISNAISCLHGLWCNNDFFRHLSYKSKILSFDIFFLQDHQSLQLTWKKMVGCKVQFPFLLEQCTVIVYFYRRTKSKNIISYQSCDYQKDRYCPQNTYRTKFTDEPSEYMQFDWSEQLVNSTYVEKLPNRGYTLKVYANNSECS